MGKNQIEYVLTQRGLHILERKGYDLKCMLCGEPLKPGEKIRKQVKRGHVTKYVHVKCFEATRIEA